MIDTEIIPANHPIALLHAIDVFQHGGLVAFPTDTVYGLGALPFDEHTVERLFTAKGRNNARAIAVLIGEFSQLSLVTSEIDEKTRKILRHFWPGSLTLIVKKHPSLPAVLSHDQTIGVRMPNHPVALSLLQKAGPLAVTSANLSGGENANTAEEVRAQLGGRIHLIIDGGRSPGGVPSSVVDCTTPEFEILRPGPISLEEILQALGENKALHD